MALKAAITIGEFQACFRSPSVLSLIYLAKALELVSNAFCIQKRQQSDIDRALKALRFRVFGINMSGLTFKLRHIFYTKDSKFDHVVL